jgi:hypothetical protein
MHKKPQGCGASAASAAGPFTTKKSVFTEVRKESPSQHTSKTQCLLRYGRFSCYLYSRCSRVVIQHLDQTFGRQSTGHGGPVNLLARSPDLNPLVFWLWGHLKTLVCSDTITDVEVLQQVENACREIRAKPGILETVRTSYEKKS